MQQGKISFYRTETKGTLVFKSKGQKERYGSCERKAKLTNVQANDHVGKSLKKGVRLYSYLCKHCLGWHVTSLPQS